MNSNVQRFWRDDRGSELMEYAFVALIILAASVPVLLMLKDELLGYVQDVFADMQVKPPTDY